MGKIRGEVMSKDRPNYRKSLDLAGYHVDWLDLGE